MTAPRVEATEEWRPIPGFSAYEASSEGRIRGITRKSTLTNGGMRTVAGRLIAVNAKHGAPKVSITEDGRGQRNRQVAGLVLAAFVGPAPTSAHRAKPVNGDPTDVRLSNLEWRGPASKPVKPPKVSKPKAPKPPKTAKTKAPAPPKTELVIDLTGLPMLSPNSRLHWASRARAVNEIRTVVALRARQAGVPTGLDRVAVEFHLRPAREWDDDNVWGAGLWKAAADALHARGRGWKHPVVVDDSRAHMVRSPAVQHRIRAGEEPAAWMVLRWGDQVMSDVGVQE